MNDMATGGLTIIGFMCAGIFGGIPIYNELTSPTTHWDIVIICGIIGIIFIAVSIIGNVLYYKHGKSIKNAILNQVIKDNQFALEKIEGMLKEQDVYTTQENAKELHKVVSKFTDNNYRLADILAILKELERKWDLG